ncbi:hypothetical protein GobsT_51580 [Gemmata obscuriglobus]|uniref:HTH HARE-type domain-containing protein n=1 Tax=Gemmata obscuriglobus TaxID=114 RepID=A0A2Z3GY56_9BACT|nr:winged helix-turn-helix domain-containing protein [Gemmata obscuriglobus]AWM36962.1 hypothetical protein C1280_07970 [Gemmata obscuriglobus]QEG30353.1 hypothetical protein GobsT_51580 [Gemmata obscuriglobus]VTS09677.1 restriction endonuclease : Restriction endonuclease OS=Isosphaera pallida (strain ATCC 43644 / DSM 9630 / IS1B) GN=Isop_2450 PE=4 SV=1: HARE-HTH [Gemmata obscuriglobus UQM 2246]
MPATKTKAAKKATSRSNVKGAKPKHRAKDTAESAPAKKLSALDAAARVLAASGESMTAKELIGRLAAQGLWSSPNGKTPDATLSAALQREIATQGTASRFRKTAPGRFAATTAGATDATTAPKTKGAKVKPKKAPTRPAEPEAGATIPDGTPGPKA